MDHARAAGLDGGSAGGRPTAHAIRGDVAWCRRLCRQDPVGDLAWQSWWRVRITDGDPAVADSRFRSVAGAAARPWVPVSPIWPAMPGRQAKYTAGNGRGRDECVRSLRSGWAPDT